MATRNASSSNIALLTICPGCHSVFKAPLLLPCCHTVCLECVEVTNAGMSRCPKCQSETERQPDFLPRDVITERIVSVESVRSDLKEKGSVLCAECEEEVSSAKYFCLVCTKPICELDFKLHKRMYKDTHQVISIEEVKLKSLEQLYPRQVSFKCTFHSDTVAFKFCKTCHMFLCACCLSHHHPDHPTISGEDARQEVSELSQQNRDKYEGLDNEDYNAAENFLKKVSMLRVDVEAQFDDIKRVLEERREELIRKLDFLYEDTLRIIQRGENRRREHVRDLIEKSRAYEHLAMDGNLLINLEAINCKVVELLEHPPTRTKYRDIEFLMHQDVKCLLKALGCFKLEYTHDILPDYAIETRAPHSYHKFTPFFITKGNNDLFYNLTPSCEVMVMDKRGTVLYSFQPPHLKNTSVNAGFIHWNKGLLYIVVGKKHSVTVCTEKGIFVKRFGSEGVGQGQFDAPLSIAVSNRNGDIYVLEEGNNRVQVFNAQYKFLRFIGNAICTPGKIRTPIELALTRSDEVLVAHRDNPCVNMYNSYGALLKQFGDSLGGYFCSLSAMTITHMGQVILSDLNQKRIIVYDPDLTTVWTVGRRGTGRGEYSIPLGIVCMDDGTVFVCDRGNQRILVYERNSLFFGCD